RADSHFFSYDPATTPIYALSLHALFRSHCAVTSDNGYRHGETHQAGVQLQDRCHCDAAAGAGRRAVGAVRLGAEHPRAALRSATDRKSTRLNSSHVKISYAVFCLKKKKS